MHYIKHRPGFVPDTARAERVASIAWMCSINRFQRWKDAAGTRAKGCGNRARLVLPIPFAETPRAGTVAATCH
jgi:hypothetical protein